MTIVHILPVRFRSTLSGSDERSTTHFGLARKHGSHALEHHEVGAGRFTHHLGVTPAWIQAVDDNATLSGGCAHKVTKFTDGEDFQEFGDVVPGE